MRASGVKKKPEIVQLNGHNFSHEVRFQSYHWLHDILYAYDVHQIYMLYWRRAQVNLICIAWFSRFSSLYFQIYSVPFSRFSALGSGPDERTRTPLGAHQNRILIANEREHGCCDLQPNYVSCIGNSTSSNLLHQCIILFASFHSYQSLALITLLQETKRI
jgi:hypothetical protein